MRDLMFLDDSDLAERIKKELGNKYIYYHKNDYLIKNKHYNMYKDVFDKCEKEGIKKIIFPQDIADIDILYNELLKRDIKVIFRVPFREVVRSRVREDSFKKLLNLPQIERCLVFNVDTQKYKKCIYLTDPLNEKREDWNIERTNKFFTVLFFGRISKAKGIDLFNKAAMYNNLLFKAIGSSKYYDGKPNFQYIEFIDKYIEDDKIPEVFINADIIVMPYSSFYEHGSSGVLPQACFAKKLIVVTNVYPFNKIIKKYKLGLISKDNPKSLSKCITKIFNNYSRYKKMANFDGYINSLDTWKKISSYF